VQRAQVPVFFIQAKNDYDTSPSKELAAAMEKASKTHAIQIFPHFGKTHQDAHEFCVHGIDSWGPQVFSFLQESFK
jgi:carboxymethylenebutenolidase